MFVLLKNYFKPLNSNDDQHKKVHAFILHETIKIFKSQ